MFLPVLVPTFSTFIVTDTPTSNIVINITFYLTTVLSLYLNLFVISRKIILYYVVNFVTKIFPDVYTFCHFIYFDLFFVSVLTYKRF